MPDLPQTSHIRLDLRGPVLHLWLNRPELRNALSQQMVTRDPGDIRGDRRRSVGARRGAARAPAARSAPAATSRTCSTAAAAPPPGATDELKDNNRRFGAMMETVNAAPQAVIAAVEGFAMGGGFGLACVADITIATADARFAMSEVKIGVVPAAISPFVVKRIGLDRRAPLRRFRRAPRRDARPARSALPISRSRTPPRSTPRCATPAIRCSPARPARSPRPNG